MYCAVPSLLADKEASKLTDIVTYKTRYTDVNGKMLTISFGLGDSISVNTIIGLPTFRAWELVLNLSSNRVSSKLLDVDFDLSYQHAATGLPSTVTFDTSDFIQPVRSTKIGTMLSTQVDSTNEPESSLTNNDNIVVLNIVQEQDLEIKDTVVEQE